MSSMLDDVETLIREGNHMTVFVSDVAVLGPEKFETPMVDAAG